MLLTFWQTHKVFFKTFAICFAIMFLALSFAPPLSSDAHAVALVDDGIFMIIIALLAACGITISASSAETALEWVEDVVNEFCASVGSVWDTVKSSFRIGVNKLGDILTNNSLLTWFSDFVEWLKSDYNLTDNTDTPIIEPSSLAGTFFLRGIPFIRASTSDLPFTIATFKNSYGTEILFNFTYSNFASDDVYFTFFSSSDSPAYAVVLPNPDSLTTYIIRTQFGRTTSTSTLDANGYAYIGSNGNNLFSEPALSIYELGYTRSDIELIFSSPVVSSEISTPSVDFVTAGVGTLDIPVDGTDYDNEDGTLVTGIGSWGDSLNDILDKIREWLDSQSPAGVIDPALEIAPEADIVDQLDPDLLSPENWPAIIPPLSLHDFSFNSIWHYVTDWIASFSGTLSTILGITFALPAVSIVYAVIVISLALWLIRRATQ